MNLGIGDLLVFCHPTVVDGRRLLPPKMGDRIIEVTLDSVFFVDDDENENFR